MAAVDVVIAVPLLRVKYECQQLRWNCTLDSICVMAAYISCYLYIITVCIDAFYEAFVAAADRFYSLCVTATVRSRTVFFFIFFIDNWVQLQSV